MHVFFFASFILKFEKIFLGDAGSTLLGFTISWALIYFTQPPISTFNPIFAIWCVTLPVYDLFYVILKRISIKKSPMAGDRNHFDKPFHTEETHSWSIIRDEKK